MKTIMDKVQYGNYMVHLFNNEPTLYFEVYPIQQFSDLKKSGILYFSKDNKPELMESFVQDKCLMKFCGYFCRRGVWEGRLYFTDDEYFGEEIEELSRLYNYCIVPWCINFINIRDGINPYA